MENGSHTETNSKTYVDKKEINTPKIRFSEFTDEWKTITLNDICIFLKGKGISKKDISKEGIDCVRYGELYTYYDELINETVSKTNINKENLVFSKKNDIIIPSTGETAIDMSQASCITKDNIAIVVILIF
ncbi:restriction endonuclease subunit S [Methanobrevibacter sp. 87.7]|uniref:restriction endonuclease subunit S n=1 Tax=Methanobrevibacter sp. 87.7 TaxID=387957 RepID=UPI000B50DDC5|nr:restriction endonuclease subunit S [Methanobrevibacter sp. 87.7]